MASWRDSMFLGGALFALALPAAGASRLLDQRVPLAANGTVVLSNVAGSVTVEGWERAEVHLTGALEPGVERLDVRRDGNRLVVKVLPGGSARDGEAMLKLRVPQGATLEISTVSADIELLRVVGEQRVSSVSGDVRVERGAGTVEASTVSGDLTLGLEAARSLRLRSTSGDIRVTASSERGGSFEAESVSGDIAMNLAAPAGFELDAESFNGDIGNCFGAPAEKYRAMLPRSALRKVRGDGGSRVRIKTMSGDISVCDRVGATRAP